MLPSRGSSLVWTRLMWEHVRGGRGREALRLYEGMRDEGVLPSARTFVAALKACATIAEVEVVHGHVAGASTQEPDIFLATTLVDMYAKCGRIAMARLLFDRMTRRNIASWNAMIKGYARLAMPIPALQLYYALLRLPRLVPTTHTFVAVLMACSAMAQEEEEEGRGRHDIGVGGSCLCHGRGIHKELERRGLDSDIFVASTLLDMYAKCGCIAEAHTIFKGMLHKDAVSWNAMIMGYAQAEMGERALQLYMSMERECVVPNARTFTAVLKACAVFAVQKEGAAAGSEELRLWCLEQGRAIHTRVAQRGLESDIFIASTLVDVYAKCGSIADARRVFESMAHRTTVSWNAMIMGYAQMEMGESALALYARMQHDGIAANAHTYLAALKACGSLAALEVGRELHLKVQEAGLDNGQLMANCLVDMYGKCGSMSDAQLVFDSLLVRNSVTWGALIAGYSGQGDYELVFDSYKKMLCDGVAPDSITSVSVLSVCSHKGLLNKGKFYFQEMCSEYGIFPCSKHYMCMVDLLGRAGELDEAVSMVTRMPYLPNKVTWTTLLDTCQKWNNMEFGRAAFNCLMVLDERNDAAYIMMKNIIGEWETRAKLYQAAWS